MNGFKDKLKCFPSFYNWLIWWCSPILHTSRERELIQKVVDNGELVDNGGLVLNLGGGTKRYGKHVVNVDLSPLETVDLVSDISDLPYSNNSIGGVICEMVLEHTESPDNIMGEIRRVLNPNGLVYIAFPFMVGYHDSPHDFRRWTNTGFVEFANQYFSCESCGIRGGPTSALCWVLQEWLAMALSFDSMVVYKILWFVFGIAVIPLKFLDHVLAHHPMASNISSGFYYLGKKV